ncbi:MAG: hypothetical protein ACE5MI_13125 [Acidimicrobiia bacterium]
MAESLAASEDWEPSASGGVTSRAEPLLTIEPFVGWRRWSVVPYGKQYAPVLASTILGHRWGESRHRAFCTPLDNEEPPTQTHRAPDPDCTCGVYAYKGPLSEIWSGIGLWAEGHVMLWGRVLEGRLGYRAEQAQIMAPLSVRIRCEPEPGVPGWSGILCQRRPTTVVFQERAFVPLCEYHRKGKNGAYELASDAFGVMVRKELRDRYGTEVYWRGSGEWT